MGDPRTGLQRHPPRDPRRGLHLLGGGGALVETPNSLTSITRSMSATPTPLGQQGEVVEVLRVSRAAVQVGATFLVDLGLVVAARILQRATALISVRRHLHLQRHPL